MSLIRPLVRNPHVRGLGEKFVKDLLQDGAKKHLSPSPQPLTPPFQGESSQPQPLTSRTTVGDAQPISEPRIDDSDSSMSPTCDHSFNYQSSSSSIDTSKQPEKAAQSSSAQPKSCGPGMPFIHPTRLGIPRGYTAPSGVVA